MSYNHQGTVEDLQRKKAEVLEKLAKFFGLHVSHVILVLEDFKLVKVAAQKMI
jgi:hypothetical protein